LFGLVRVAAMTLFGKMRVVSVSGISVFGVSGALVYLSRLACLLAWQK
jgi:hypothetical protein